MKKGHYNPNSGKFIDKGFYKRVIMVNDKTKETTAFSSIKKLMEFSRKSRDYISYRIDNPKRKLAIDDQTFTLKSADTAEPLLEAYHDGEKYKYRFYCKFGDEKYYDLEAFKTWFYSDKF